MSATDRYRTTTLPASYDFATNTTRTHASTCNDCGVLVLNVTTHDTWHTLQAATHLRDGDVLVLTGDFSTDLQGRQHLNDLLTRLDIAHRTLVVGDGLTAQVLPRETLEPGPTGRPDLECHYAHCVTCTADFAASTEHGVTTLALDHVDRSGETGGRHYWASGSRPPRAASEPANPPCPDCSHDAHQHKGPRTGCKAAVPVAGICGCHRTAW